MKLGWLSDIHLNFLTETEIVDFFGDLATLEMDGWLVSGDIGDAFNVTGYLRRASQHLLRPVYFVLGNHDFYHGSIAGVSDQLNAFDGNPRLVWLSASDPIELGGGLALVGDEGWGDGRLGDPHSTSVELNDFRLIDELTGLSREELIAATNALGDASAARLVPKLELAVSRCSRVLVVTHVPPFAGAAWHEGQPSGPDWLPWFACEATGQVILDCASRHPETEFLVLCGHTHGAGRFAAASNVTVHTAPAEYGAPALTGVVVDDGSALRVDLR